LTRAVETKNLKNPLGVENISVLASITKIAEIKR